MMVLLKNKFFIVFVLVSLLSINILYSQNTQIRQQRVEEVVKNGEGKEFYLVFMINFDDNRGSPLENMIFLTSDFNANVRIEFPKEKQSQNVRVRAGEIVSVKLDRFSQATLFEMEDVGQAIYIQSDMPISVYGLNRRRQTTDNYLAFPVEVLGSEYMIMSYYSFSNDVLSTFAIVATEDSTTIEITPTVRTSGGKPAGKPFTITLNKGSVYQVGAGGAISQSQRQTAQGQRRGESYADLTGTHIKADKKIAVFGGHQCANIPTTAVSACNVLCEQMPPISTWGKNFYIGAFKSRSFYTYRVLASRDSTKVFEDTTLIATLNRGEFIQRNSRRNIQITADKPVLVAQYSQGSGNGDDVGDPMMILISPVQQYLRKYRFATPISGDWLHYINVFVPTNAIGSFKVNNRLVSSDNFIRFGNTKYSIASISLPFGSHFVECNAPFGLTSYGFGIQRIGYNVQGPDAYDAYGAMGGQSFIDYEPVPDTRPPHAETIISNRQRAILVTDDGRDDLGLAEITILRQDNLNLNIPRFTKGAPSVIIPLIPVAPGTPGSIVISAKDVAGNVAAFSICYVYDRTSGEFITYIRKGAYADCISAAWLLGAFYSTSYNSISSDFISTGDIITNNTFEGLTGRGNAFGLSLSRYLFNDFNFVGKLFFTTNRMALTSVDTNKRFAVSDGWQAPYTTKTMIDIDNFMMGIDLGLDWKLSDYIYFSGGLSFAFNLTKTAEIYEALSLTPGYEFSDGGNRKKIADKLESLSGLNAGLYFGPGANCNIGYGFQVFGDINYYIYPFSMLSDADLFMNKFNIRFGLRYQLPF